MRSSVQRAQRALPQVKYGIVLHASEQGRSLYERMGFKAISHVERYTHQWSGSSSFSTELAQTDDSLQNTSPCLDNLK